MKTSPYLFFLKHAGFSFDPATETKFHGRCRCARQLAQAEAAASKAGVSYAWDLDGATNREWTDEGSEYGTWSCVMHDASGVVRASLCGIDFGADGEPWDDSYRRVVEAELALEGGPF